MFLGSQLHGSRAGLSQSMARMIGSGWSYESASPITGNLRIFAEKAGTWTVSSLLTMNEEAGRPWQSSWGNRGAETRKKE